MYTRHSHRFPQFKVLGLAAPNLCAPSYLDRLIDEKARKWKNNGEKVNMDLVLSDEVSSTRSC